MIIHSKFDSTGNLELRLNYEREIDSYSISIYRHNTNEGFNCFGLFNKEGAEEKFANVDLG